MKNKYINFLLLAFLSLGILNGCKAIDVANPMCTITINNETEGVKISGITSDTVYEYGSKITLKASNVPSRKVIKWLRNGVEECSSDTYSFIVSHLNTTITTKYALYMREKNKIYFGEYPQTEVNTLARKKPTSSNTYNWTDYNYYIDGSIESYMYYQDIDYDNDGDFDYRGVYFTRYRRYYCDNTFIDTYQDDNGYYTNTIYWFSYEPIEWNILQEENGKALVISSIILDSQDYYSSDTTSKFYHNGGTGYSNNYELSNIRKFLNDNFYNTAFNDLQKEIIETTLVDNSAESTTHNDNPYICNDTNDKIFLLSYKEVTTFYSSNNKRIAKGSDYAKSQGLYVNSSSSNSYWRLRSPSLDNGYHAYNVDYGGHINDYNYVYDTYNGVRAACQIIL